MPMKALAPSVSQMMMPTVVIVRCSASVIRPRLNSPRTAAASSAATTPTPAASVTLAMPP